MLNLTAVNKILCHCHSWLAGQFIELFIMTQVLISEKQLPGIKALLSYFAECAKGRISEDLYSNRLCPFVQGRISDLGTFTGWLHEYRWDDLGKYLLTLFSLIDKELSKEGKPGSQVYFCLLIVYNAKQYGPRSDCSLWSSLIKVHSVLFSW